MKQDRRLIGKQLKQIGLFVYENPRNPNDNPEIDSYSYAIVPKNPLRIRFEMRISFPRSPQ